MSLVFYYAPMSTAVTVSWALEELGIPYEKVEIDLKARDQDKRGYRALNPNGKVPLLVHDGVPIFESAAIMMHLGETFGVERDLFPPPGLERAGAFKWLVWTNVSLGGAVARFLHNTSAQVPEERRSAKEGEVARADVETHLGILEAELADKRFLVGGTFTSRASSASSPSLASRRSGGRTFTRGWSAARRARHTPGRVPPDHVRSTD